ncbi:MAG TPA: DNA mismatch repair protein MutS, partial [Gemmatimonadales bacterium]
MSSRVASRGGADRSAADTPLMQQYRDIKTRHPGTIVFFRMGDFYEMFEDDAKLGARVLGLTLTSRNNGGAAEVPLAGVPVKAAAEYVRRLVAAGHRVAICEQTEDPKLAKGLVRREVVETVTPGAVLADDWLERNRNNYLAAVSPQGELAGIAALDLTTGEFIWESVPAADLETALARYEAPEVVVPAGAAAPAASAATRTTREAWEFDPELARDDLLRAFGLASLDGLGVEAGDAPALGAAGALLRYIRELKPGGLPHLTRPRIVRRGDVLPLDEMTRRNLELVEPLRTGVAGTTLLEVLDRTVTPLGARLLRRWLLAPLVDPAAINARLDAVAVLVADPRGRDRLREALDGVRDLERLGGRAAVGRATPRELGALRDSIRRLPDVRAGLDGLDGRERSALLEAAAERFDLLADLGDDLSRALVDRPPAQLADGDAIRAGCDAELDALKDARDGGKTYIAGLQARERERTGIGSLKVGFNRVFGYYLEITHAHRDRIPADYERRQTLTGAERYVTPELKEYEAKVLGAEERIGAREAAVIDALRQKVAAVIGRVQGTAVVIAELDVRAALADLAQREGYVRPDVNAGFTIHLEASRHPVVERMMAREAFIPNDVLLDDAGRVMLLTGPNMA